MRVQSPIAGGQRGSVGGMVFQHYHGRTYARSKPTIFHYQPTPAQKATQDKYYNIKSYWTPIYRRMQPYFPAENHNSQNWYNLLSRGVYEASQTYEPWKSHEEIHNFGVDVYKHIQIQQTTLSVIRSGSRYSIRLNGFSFQSDVEFVPQFAHALMFCTDLQQIEYEVVPYTTPTITWPFSNGGGWFPGHTLHLYMALSNDEHFSNFFY